MLTGQQQHEASAAPATPLSRLLLCALCLTPIVLKYLVGDSLRLADSSGLIPLASCTGCCVKGGAHGIIFGSSVRKQLSASQQRKLSENTVRCNQSRRCIHFPTLRNIFLKLLKGTANQPPPPPPAFRFFRAFRWRGFRRFPPAIAFRFSSSLTVLTSLSPP